jgi:antitoxin component of MazEF toxin-antitoxin module
VRGDTAFSKERREFGMHGLEVEAGLRPENELTLPDAVVESLELQPGDRLIFEIDDEDPGSVRLRPIRRSYAGLLAGVYGTPEEAAAYIEEERASWSESE